MLWFFEVYFVFVLRNNIKQIRRKEKFSFYEDDYFPFEFFLIVLYCLNRVQKHAKEYYIFIFITHANQ